MPVRVTDLATEISADLLVVEMVLGKGSARNLAARVKILLAGYSEFIGSEDKTVPDQMASRTDSVTDEIENLYHSLDSQEYI
jgi:hypothetical protein